MPDPLSGIPFTIRLQAHNGDGVPSGLWQDVSCTIPATQDFDPVAGWTDTVGGTGTIATQSDVALQPFLLFEDDLPYLVFDGVDDYLECSESSGSSGTGYTIFTLYNRESGETVVAEDNIGDRGFSLRYNQLELNGDTLVTLAASGLSCVSVVGTGQVFINNVETTTFSASLNAHSANTSIGRRQYPGFAGYFGGSVGGVLISSTAVSDANRERVEIYLTTITPPTPSSNVSGLIMGYDSDYGPSIGGAAVASVVEDEYLTPDSSQYYVTPSGSQYYQQP